MKVVLYCQHVLGLGHFMRSLALARALAPHPVVLVSGGPPVAVDLPGNVSLLALPPLAMDTEFSAVFSPGGDIEAVKARRAALLLEVLERERPDYFLVELYPFGRRAFEFELIPALEALRAGRFGAARAVCSLRDLLVEKRDPKKYQGRVLERLNGLFDGLLVHADPSVFRLEDTFGAVEAIRVPMCYTGFVATGPGLGARERLRAGLGLLHQEKLIVVSAGGGRVGWELPEACLAVHTRVSQESSTKMHVFTGPFLDDATFARLVSSAGDLSGVCISRFASDFADRLAAADLSVSLAGYNTIMNVLAARCPALVWPFGQNQEQSLRARRLEALGALRVLGENDLAPGMLAGLILEALARGKDRTDSAGTSVDLDGARFTAWLLSRGWPPSGTFVRNLRIS